MTGGEDIMGYLIVAPHENGLYMGGASQIPREMRRLSRRSFALCLLFLFEDVGRDFE